ncbi:hypothetical protein RHSIM_Rhsim07G0106100 [Rhododendron simsii]|uniref:Bifunctional inhibitor/plant lipid transfer protein/seed storage helical domain-containing protein n=1 Tax=Rhododendron simsii TaxID=118357 RepID=A0A834GSU8_RHOSS|nr:hypothetical protein RHSIM_Rhsim07G0106100 [Rhododendron simsii]
MSTAVDRVADKIEYMSGVDEVLADKTVEVLAAAAPVVSEVAVAATDSAFPVAALQYLIDNVLSFTGFNCPNPTTPSSATTCPRDALKLGVCIDLLGGLINVVVGTPPTTPCCSLIQGLADLEAAVCLCTAIKANILGINLNIPLSLTLLLNVCGKNAPPGFQCA